MKKIKKDKIQLMVILVGLTLWLFGCATAGTKMEQLNNLLRAQGSSPFDAVRHSTVSTSQLDPGTITPTGEIINMSELAYDKAKMNLMPANPIGDSKIRSNQAGWKVMNRETNRYRLYEPSGELNGVFKTLDEAENMVKTD